MPQRMRDDKPKEDWLCRTCQFKDGVPYKNFGSRKTCKGGCDLDKVNCYKGPAFKPGIKDPAKHIPDTANKQAQQMQQMQNKLDHANKALRASNEEVKELKKTRPGEHTMEVDSTEYPDSAKQ